MITMGASEKIAKKERPAATNEPLSFCHSLTVVRKSLPKDFIFSATTPSIVKMKAIDMRPAAAMKDRGAPYACSGFHSCEPPFLLYGNPVKKWVERILKATSAKSEKMICFKRYGLAARSGVEFKSYLLIGCPAVNRMNLYLSLGAAR